MRSRACFVRKLTGTSKNWRWPRHTEGRMEFLSLQLTIGYKDKPPVFQGLRLEVHQGEVLGLVGHSGCGKSSLALALLGLIGMKGGQASGSMLWQGRELMGLKEKDWLSLRGKE